MNFRNRALHWACLAAGALLIWPFIGLESTAAGQGLEGRAQKYLIDMVRLAPVNPPGNETPVSKYLQAVATQYGIACELLGDDPKRMNFVARLTGNGNKRPLLLMAHSDVVPAEPRQWSQPPFEGLIKDGMIYGRGTVDTLGLLAAEMSVLVELKQRNVELDRDIILLSEADEEAGSTGIQWMIKNAWPKIDAEFALNEGGVISRTSGGPSIFQIQTTEKIPTRVILTAHGTAAHGSLPREDNAVVHLARAVAKLADAQQPVKLNTTTERYFSVIAGMPGHDWMEGLLPVLKNGSGKAVESALETVRDHEPEIAAMLTTTVSPTMFNSGVKINVIPNTAEAKIDVRRLPGETSTEIYERFRRIINDPAIDVKPEEGQQMPDTEPSSMTSPLYLSMERVFLKNAPQAKVVPYMLRGATDGSYLREKGMAVYGVPVFQAAAGLALAHANDERLGVDNLGAGARLLLEVVEDVCKN